VLITGAIGLGGCFPVEGGGNIADAYGDWAGFCGFLQDCGSHSDGNRSGQGATTTPAPSSDPPSDPGAATGPAESAEPAGPPPGT
jgi:hypothetical protein